MVRPFDYDVLDICFIQPMNVIMICATEIWSRLIIKYSQRCGHWLGPTTLYMFRLGRECCWVPCSASNVREHPPPSLREKHLRPVELIVD